MKLPTLSTKAIRAYVAALPPDEPVGWRKDGQQCIVARYIRSVVAPHGEYHHITVAATRIDVVMFNDCWHTLDAARRTPSPALRRIIERFDALPMREPLPADVLPIFDKEPTP